MITIVVYWNIRLILEIQLDYNLENKRKKGQINQDCCQLLSLYANTTYNCTRNKFVITLETVSDFRRQNMNLTVTIMIVKFWQSYF